LQLPDDPFQDQDTDTFIAGAKGLEH
jgi:hypothetical protein